MTGPWVVMDEREGRRLHMRADKVYAVGDENEGSSHVFVEGLGGPIVVPLSADRVVDLVKRATVSVDEEADVDVIRERRRRRRRKPPGKAATGDGDYDADDFSQRTKR